MFLLKKPRTGELLLVGGEDFLHKLEWDQAVSACKNLGDGWRLPTKLELQLMHKELYLSGTGNFNHYWYWSSEHNGLHIACAIKVSDGGDQNFRKHMAHFVRAVCGVPQ
jgi:hypothetical protein